MHLLRTTMERLRICCPETQSLTEIELERTPAGTVICECNRFAGREIDCARTCAAILDQQDRQGRDDFAERVLVAHTGQKSARLVAHALAQRLARDGMIVELTDLDTGNAPAAADYDAVVVGARTFLGRLPRSVSNFALQHRETLASLPTFLYTIGRADLGRLQRLAGWCPEHHAELERARGLAHWFGDPESCATQDAPAITQLALDIEDEIPLRPLD